MSTVLFKGVLHSFFGFARGKKEVTGLSCNNKIGAGVFCSNKALGLVKALRMNFYSILLMRQEKFLQEKN